MNERNIKKVLVIDDDPIILNQMERELQRNFFKTYTAKDGKSAREIFKSVRIDIMLLDLKLPDTTGFELLVEFKEKYPDSEVIVITGYGSQEVAIQSLRRGALDYVEKPVNLEELSAALGRAIEKLAEREKLGYKNTLLVIDDEKEITKRMKRLLQKEGYEVFVAFDGKTGLDIIASNKIDVVITDIVMSDMSGIEVLTKAKKIYTDIEGIMVTGHFDETLAIQSLRAGAIDYITKPVNLDRLFFSIKQAIERINLNRNRLYRRRELKLSSEIVAKMNEELERRINERSDELNKTQAQLFQTSKLATLGEMSAGLAHEMNQPLGGISLVAKNLRKLLERDQLTDEQVMSGLNDIDASVKRMNRIIQHIRTFARQDTLKFIEVDAHETISSALSLLGEQLRLHEITLKEEYDTDLPKIIGEPYQLEQVWINLITNARDAMDEKEKRIQNGKLQDSDYRKELIISTNYDSASEYVITSFSDNGIGITKDEKEKVFDPFFTTKEVGKATGLGLSISYGIIESHQGKIEISGEADEGVTVRVMLPLKINPENLSEK